MIEIKQETEKRIFVFSAALPCFFLSPIIVVKKEKTKKNKEMIEWEK